MTVRNTYRAQDASRGIAPVDGFSNWNNIRSYSRPFDGARSEPRVVNASSRGPTEENRDFACPENAPRLRTFYCICERRSRTKGPPSRRSDGAKLYYSSANTNGPRRSVRTWSTVVLTIRVRVRSTTKAENLTTPVSRVYIKCVTVTRRDSFVCRRWRAQRFGIGGGAVWGRDPNRADLYSYPRANAPFFFFFLPFVYQRCRIYIHFNRCSNGP